MNILLFVLSFSLLGSASNELNSENNNDPVRITVAGLIHDHVHWIFGVEDPQEFEIVGIYDSNTELHERYAEWYNLSPDLFYTDLDNMLDSVQPEAVTAFGSTYDHLALVEESAPRGIDIMVEKPLAVNMEHASRMKDLADEHNVHLITNYETTWYSSNHEVHRLFHEENRFGDIRKMVVHDGHQGPKEIGVSDEFLEWLIDPKLNGGGAIMDFGCYGANLMTWMMKGEEPVSVTAVTQTHKPEIYGEVDDEATVILTYPEAQGIVQASWNWPYNRKDMHVYGVSGFAYAQDDVTVDILFEEGEPMEGRRLDEQEAPFNDPFSYFAGVVRGTIQVSKTDLSSLENNITVMKILDAARKSAETGKTIYLDEQR